MLHDQVMMMGLFLREGLDLPAFFLSAPDFVAWYRKSKNILASLLMDFCLLPLGRRSWIVFIQGIQQKIQLSIRQVSQQIPLTYL